MPHARRNILLVATEWDSGHGGISTFNRELAVALAKENQNVLCLVPKASADEISRAERVGVTLIVAKPTFGEPILALARKMPGDPSVDVIVGHARITGPAALVQKEEHYPRARLVHFLHMDSSAIEPFKTHADSADIAEIAEQRMNLECDLPLWGELPPVQTAEGQLRDQAEWGGSLGKSASS